jgi:signal transduction histidine kinase
MLTGNPDLIAQLLDKLMSNAVEFSNKQDAVKVRLTFDQDDALLRVINDGPSLPIEMQDQLFDSMVSVRKEYDGNTSHLGLGLYIAKIITQFHGGTIKVSDREDTQGVIVTLRIPLLRLSTKLRK